MASPYPHHTQPGPSSLSYYHQPPHLTNSGNPPYPFPPQQPQNPRIPNGPSSRGGYHQQGSSRGGPAYYPYPPFYPPLEHQQHVRPPGPHYQQHHMNGGPMYMGYAPNHSPNHLPQSIHPNIQRHTFSPSFHPQYAKLSPGHSPSALPKQLRMPHSPPQYSSPLNPVSHLQHDPPPLSSPRSSQQLIATTPTPLSPDRNQGFATVVPFPPSHTPPSPGNPNNTLSDGSTSPDPLLSPSLSIQPEPLKPFAERSNSNFSYIYKRPDVSAAAAVTVASTARPPLSFYYLTACQDDEPAEAPTLSSEVARAVSSDPADVPKSSKQYPAPDSPQQQQSLASSVTTTTSTSPNTPTPDSPLSSVTSVSLAAKSSPGKLPVSPASSVRTIATDPPELVPKPAPAPLKKTWASLLRPATTDGPGASTPTSPNSLPTSSVQGFSIPASRPTPAPAKMHDPPSALVALLTAPHTSNVTVPPQRARGLVNLGNMCFANTVLQVLVFCPQFYSLFVELARTPREDATRATPLVDATVEFIKEFQLPKRKEGEETGRDSFVPTCLYDGLKEKKRFDSMRSGQQEDAEEFLGFYLDALEEELLSLIAGVPPPVIPAPVEERVEKDTPPADGWLEVGKKNKSVVTRTHKSVESPISHMFGGRFRTALRVPGARESVIVDPWSRLQLDIQPDHVRTIEDALRHGAAPGTVQVTRPGAQGDASQQTLIDALPPVLVLHLKRFLYDTTVGDVIKLRKRVEFSTDLEVPKEAMALARRARAHKYKLFGVLNHHGSSATGGHYTLDVLHPNGQEGWLRIDDELVQPIREEDLLARDVGDDRTAYLLFYQRITTPGPRM